MGVVTKYLKPPIQVVTCEKPQVSHFYVFFCLAYIHIPNDKRSKIGTTKLKGFFVGYNEFSKVYKVYVQSQQKIIASWDVKFDDEFWSSNLQYLI